MNRPHRIKQAVVAFVAALLLALSILGGSAYAGGVAGGPIIEQPCWMCGGGK